MTHDYYQLLHVLPDAPAPVIKASYRAMMQKLRNHPDLGGDPARAQLLNEAVDILCDPARRASYDRELQLLQSRLEQAASASDSTAPETSKQSRTGRDSDTPGGRPEGYESRAEQPESQGNPEPVRQSVTVPPTPRPSRPHCLFCKAGLSTASGTHQHYLSNDQCPQCTAPVSLLEELDASATEELRRTYRHDHQATVKLWTRWPMDAPLEALLHDLSLAGCAIVSQTSLPGNSMVLLDTDALKAICEVRYCKPAGGNTGFSLGLAFRTLKIKARPGSMFTAVA